ncbi:MAG: DHHW family protein, partial [Clostridium sp.]|nr:DHHW family protein [Clostridium sp.]
MKKKLLIYSFFVVLLSLSVLDIIEPLRVFSELENRNLSRKVKFTFKSYINGSFSEKYDNYVSDQFIGRNDWINLKSIAEHALGKTENNNILFGRDDFLFEKVTSIDEARENLNISAVNIFAENCDAPVSVILAPNSYIVYKEYLPKHVPIIDGEREMEKIYSMMTHTNNISIIDAMNRHKNDELLYYRTDHHWTTDGAYLAYEEYMKSIGMDIVVLTDYKEENQSYKEEYVPDFLGTYYSKAKPSRYKYDTIAYYDFGDLSMEINGETYDGIYDLSKADVSDKYALFIYGNNPLSIIENDKIDGHEKILVIKDSYANSFVPFLSQNFNEVHIMDLRSYHGKVSEYIKENQFDQVLILYNFTTFIRDSD